VEEREPLADELRVPLGQIREEPRQRLGVCERRIEDVGDHLVAVSGLERLEANLLERLA